MVAYSFRPQFAEPIATLVKLQTVRAVGKRRHARPGEPVQLYTGMRTRECRKLLDIDPICIDVQPIELVVRGFRGPIFTRMVIDGVSLSRWDINAFALADGFDVPGEAKSFAHLRMAHFWLEHHGEGAFEGVVIRWEPSDAG